MDIKKILIQIQVDAIFRSLVSWSDFLICMPDKANGEAVREVAYKIYRLTRQLQILIQEPRTRRDWRRQKEHTSRIKKDYYDWLQNRNHHDDGQ